MPAGVPPNPVAPDAPALGSQVVRSGFWLLAGSACNRGLAFVRTAILGRVLSPVDFGVAAIGQLSVQWIEYFSQSGFNTSLILTPSDLDLYLNTAWTVHLLRGIGLSALLFACAPLAASLFNNPGATPVVRAVAIIILIRGFDSPAVACLRREMNFRRETIWHMSGVVAGLVTAIPLALIYRNFWALVISMVAAQAAETATSYWATPFHPRLEFDRARAREMTRTGKWIFWNNIFLFPGRFLDSLLIGRFLGTAALGYYQMAGYLALIIPDQLATHTGSLLLPAFAKLQTSSDLRRGYLRSFGALCAALVPIGVVLTAFAGLIVRIALGPKWALASALIGPLVWSGIFGAVCTMTTQMLLRVGRAHFTAWSSLLKALVLALIGYPAMRLSGSVGVAFAVTFASLAAMFWQLMVVGRALDIGPWDLLRSIGTSVRELIQSASKLRLPPEWRSVSAESAKNGAEG